MNGDMAESILVTGASGGLGSRIVRRLAEQRRPRILAAFGRDAARLPQLDGVHLRCGDYEDPRSIREALVGVDTLVFVSSDGDRTAMWRHHQNVATEAARAGLRRIVYTSILDIDPVSRFYYEPVHRRTEALLADVCRSCAVVRTSVFADFFVSTWAEQAVRSGVLAVPAENGRVSFVTREDVAAVVAALAGLAAEGHSTLQATGPIAYDMAEVATILGRIAGRPVAYRPADPGDYAATLREGGNPEWLVDAFTSFFAAIAEQRFAAVSPDLRRILGRQPGDFPAYAAAALGQALG